MTAAGVAHQLVHGYDKGHRLLAGSRPPGLSALRLVDRLSDAAGLHRPPGSGPGLGLLTGYPLPDGEYALAATWPDLDAPRPNTVWTHTLILPGAALAAADLAPLAALLRRPAGHHDLDAYTVPIALPQPGGMPPTPAPVGQAGRLALDAVYGPRPTGVAAPDDDPATLCLAIWAQQWPRLRRRFAFCSYAPEPRRLDTRPFDLILLPPGSRPPAALPLPPRVLDALAADLAEPGLLRKFLRACGADSSRTDDVALLTATWLRAPRAADPRAILADIAGRAPDPDSLRRLKRALLRGPDALLALADPVLALAALADPSIGSRMRADDADADAWAHLAWHADPRGALRTTQPWAIPDDDAAAPESRPSPDALADEAARRSVEQLATTRARPDDLTWLAADRPDLAVLTLTARPATDWWDAWAALTDTSRDALAPAAAGTPSTATAATTALLRRNTSVAAWTPIRDANAVNATYALLAASTATPMPDDWARAAGDHADAIAARLRDNPDPSLSAAAADLAARAPRLARLPHELWQPLADRPELWDHHPVRAAVLLNAALDATGPDADRTAGLAYHRLHTALAGPHPDQRTDAAWRLIQPRLPGRHDDWDRCRRLAQGIAAAALRRPRIFDNAPDGPALNQLHAAAKQQRTDGKRTKSASGILGFFQD